MNNSWLVVFIILLLSGLFLIGAEIFVPGGVLGAMGGISLVACVVVAFLVFPPQLAFLVALGIVILMGLCLVLWIRFFPHTPIGRSLTLSRDARSFKADRPDLKYLLDQEGVTLTDLHPSGIAEIQGQRIDVVAEGGWITKDSPVKVIDVEGNHVLVRALDRKEEQE